MTIQEKKISLRKFLGENGIHSLGLRDGLKIHVYHEGEIPEDVKKSIETEAQPYLIEYHKESMPVIK